MQMAPFGIILVIMYFLLFRPQQQKAKAHKDMVSNIRRGDSVVTNGGLIGKVTKTVDDSEIEIEIAPNVRVRQSVRPSPKFAPRASRSRTTPDGQKRIRRPP